MSREHEQAIHRLQMDNNYKMFNFSSKQKYIN